MKKIIVAFAVLFLALTQVQSQNPYAALGIEEQVLHYDDAHKEVFDSDSIKPIGYALYSIKDGLIAIYDLNDSLVSFQKIDPSKVARWLSIDPLASEYQSWSPYNYTLGNPIRFIDPDGRSVTDWYKDTDGTVQYDPNVKSQADLSSGQTYMGESFKEKGASGKMAYYNNGGSIFFKSETDAYNYIWNNTEKTNREHLGVVFSDGVSVLPSYANNANTSEIESVGFRFEQKGKNSFLASDNYTHNKPVLGTVHSHNADKSGSEGVSGSDVMAFGTRTPGRPALVFENNENGVGGFLDGVISHSRKDWGTIDRKSMPSLQNVLDGKAGLIVLFKQIK
jgi:uncharacterized protein RhaS with RHS repeats